MSPLLLWLLIVVMGLITYAFRLSMIVGQIELPVLVRRALRYVPFAVLTALFVPALLFPAPNNNFDLSLGNARMLAGILAIVVAFRTRNVLLTVGVGMVGLWLLLALHGGS
jgi:branched-subunit amino acid transport protein